MRVKIVFAIFLSVCFISCKRNRLSDEMIKKWIGKELKYDDAIFTIMGKDTINFNLDDFDYKILTYVDSKGCTACQMKIEEWKEYMNMVDSLWSGKVGFIFYYAPESFRTVAFVLQEHNFDYPVIIDTVSVFRRRNSIPNNYMLQTFLLDKENRIVAVGNPVINIKIETLYNQIIGATSN